MTTLFFKLSAIVLASFLASATPSGGVQQTQVTNGYLTLSSYSVMPQDHVTVSGAGFQPNETVTVTLAGESQTVTADSTGSFGSPTFQIPFDSTRSNIAVMAETGSGATTTTELAVGGYYPQIKPNSYYLIPGNDLQFSGDNFAPEEDVDIMQGETLMATAHADGGGNMVSPIFKTPYAGGDQTYTFVGHKSMSVTDVTVSLDNQDGIVTMDSHYGKQGDTVHLSGMGFGAGEEILIEFDGQELGRTVTDNSGNYSWHGAVPGSGTYGEKTLTVTGLSTGRTAETSYTLANMNQ